MTFQDLNLAPALLKAVEEVGYTNPTPIQAQSIPILLKGSDLLGCAQTGTGKTAAFSLPILHHLLNDAAQGGKRRVRALVVTPTRELALQIADNFTLYAKHTGIRNTVIFGGVKQGNQVSALKRGVDVLVATPGRLLDLMGQGYISLKDLEYFVLDEADQMLDMGFIHDIKKVIAALPRERQSLFFSATMPPAIKELSSKILGKYEQVTIQPEQTTAERVEQQVYFVHKGNKSHLLVHLIAEEQMESALVFSRTKHGANKIVRFLEQAGVTAGAIHGNKSQAARQKALAAFKDGELKILVATDIAARGIDISGLPWVINYDLPNVPETYVHRIGRTGRAGFSGTAVSFCNGEEREFLRDIQKLIKQQLPVVKDHPFTAGAEEMPAPGESVKDQGKGNRRGGRSGGGRSQGGGGRGGSKGRGPGGSSRSSSGGSRRGGSSSGSGSGRKRISYKKQD